MYLIKKYHWSILLFALVGQSLNAQFNKLPLKPSRFTTIETNEGTFMNLDSSPVTGDIVFELLGNIFLLPENEKKAIQLTEGLSWDSYPIFSPDGKKIAFISDRSGIDMVYTMNIDGSLIKQIKASKSDGAILSISWLEKGQSKFDNFYSYVLKTPRQKTVSSMCNRNEINFKIKKNKILRIKKDEDSTSIIHLLPENFTTSQFQISPDGNYLAYVNLNSRMNKDFVDNELFLINTTTGKLIYKKKIGKYLKHFPNFGFNRYSNKLIIPFNGKIHSIDLTTYDDEIIPFHASIKVILAERVYHEFPIKNDSIKLTRFRWTQPYEDELIYSSLGKFYTYSKGVPQKLLNNEFEEYYPVFSKEKNTLFFTSWDKKMEGFIWKMKKNGDPEKIVEKPGLYKYLAVSREGRYLAYIKAERKWERFEENRGSGILYIRDLEKNSSDIFENKIPALNSISFSQKGNEVRFIDALHHGKLYRELLGLNINTGKRRPIAQIKNNIDELIINPAETYLAFVYLQNLYLLDLRNKSRPYSLVTDKELSQAIQITFEGVTDPIFLNDQTIAWSQGAFYHKINLNPAVLQDFSREKLLKIQQSKPLIQYKIIEKANNLKALTGVRIITINNKDQVIENGTILIQNDRIQQVGKASEITIPKTAEVHRLDGKTIIPGLIDMHGHDGPPDDVLEKNWNRFLINFAYGITTLRDPSVGPDYYSYNSLSEAGMITAPRLFGAAALVNSKFDINSFQDAKDWVRTQKLLGAKYIKVHDAWNRKQRQFLVKAANNEQLNIIGHPDSYTYSGKFNLSVLLDGFTTWEHIIPFGKFYDDARQLISFSKTYYTLTGTTMGGEFYKLKDRVSEAPVEKMNLCQDSIYKKFTSYRMVPRQSIYQPYVQDAFRILQNGGNIPIGSHGDIPGLEFHWEMWSFTEGGMSPLQALRAGTLMGAKGLGMQKDLGSLEPEKIADLIILNGNPLDDFKQTMNINAIMQNGILFSKSDLFELCEKRKETY